MMEVKYQLNKFENALKRLKEVLRFEGPEDILIDATIQRFEFTFEMAWKSIKVVLKYFGEDCNSPRNCIKKAYKNGWVKEEDEWLTLLDARNKTSHTYNQQLAKEVFETVKANINVFETLLTRLKSELE